jgi:hypothetical protein
VPACSEPTVTTAVCVAPTSRETTVCSTRAEQTGDVHVVAAGVHDGNACDGGRGHECSFAGVVHGAIEVDLLGPGGRELHRLHAGDSLLYPGGTPHRWRVLTEEQDPSGVHILTVENAPR